MFHLEDQNKFHFYVSLPTFQHCNLTCTIPTSIIFEQYSINSRIFFVPTNLNGSESLTRDGAIKKRPIEKYQA